MSELNVPYSAPIKPLSLSDAVGKWTEINGQQQKQQYVPEIMQQAAEQHAQQQRQGELKFGNEQRTAHQQILTEFKSVLNKKAQELGLQPNTPQYQQLANGIYANTFDSPMQQLGGAPAYKAGTDIDLNAIESVVTPAEQYAQDMTKETAKQDAMFSRQKQLAEMNYGHQDQADTRNFEQSKLLAGINHGYDLESKQMENTWDTNAKMELDQQKQKTAQAKPLPIGALKIAQADIQTINDANTAVSEVSGLLQNIDSGVLKTDLYTKAKAGVQGALNMADKETEALAEFETKRQGLANKLLLLAKGVQTDGDALRADIENFKNATDTKVAKNMLENIKAKFEREAMLRGHNVESIYEQYGKDAPDLSYSVDKGTLTHDFSNDKQQEIPPGYKMQRNKRTGETRLVKVE